MSAITTITRAFRGSSAEKPARCYLIPLDIHHDDRPMLALKRSFQYFPSTIQDSQATNYQAKVIPGLSHPLYQWTSGGARTISFQAIFTRDRTYTDAEKAAIKGGSDTNPKPPPGADHFGSLMAHFGPSSLGIQQNDDPRNVDIPSAVGWLRSHLLPEYSKDGLGTFDEVPQRPLPPRKLILGVPGLRLNWGVPNLPPEEVYCIMTGCQATYDAFFHDGTPRIAKVALTFAEIIQVGGTVTVHDAGNKRQVVIAGYTTNDQTRAGTK